MGTHLAAKISLCHLIIIEEYIFSKHSFSHRAASIPRSHIFATYNGVLQVRASHILVQSNIVPAVPLHVALFLFACFPPSPLRECSESFLYDALWLYVQ